VADFAALILKHGGNVLNAFQSIWNGLDWSVFSNVLLNVLPALVCITLHELAHGFVAYKLGDPTAKDQGRLTLNPIKHIDIVGLVMMVAVGFGWAKAVPVNMNNFKKPKRDMAITAAAGPVCNILIACVMLLIYGLLYYPISMNFGSWTVTLFDIIFRTAYLSTALAVFNLIPIPPLDGSKVVFSALSEEGYYKLMHYERYGMIILMVLLISNVLDTPLSTAAYFVFDKLFYISKWAFSLVMKFF